MQTLMQGHLSISYKIEVAQTPLASEVPYKAEAVETCCCESAVTLK